MGVLTTHPPRTSQVAVDITPTLVVGVSDKRVGVLLFNNGPDTVFVGFTESVTITQGLGIPSGAGISFDSPHALYVVAVNTGSTVSFMEESR